MPAFAGMTVVYRTLISAEVYLGWSLLNQKEVKIMKSKELKILLAIAGLLLALQSISFSATNGLIEEKIIVALQGTPKVELYITSWCPYCKKAVNFFQSRKIPFTAYDIEKDEKSARLKDQLDSKKGVPFAIINSQKIHGFSEEAYLKALQTK
jgi:glutaredoxin